MSAVLIDWFLSLERFFQQLIGVDAQTHRSLLGRTQETPAEEKRKDYRNQDCPKN